MEPTADFVSEEAKKELQKYTAELEKSLNVDGNVAILAPTNARLRVIEISEPEPRVFTEPHKWIDCITDYDQDSWETTDNVTTDG